MSEYTNRPAGFTLTELLATLAVTGVVMSMALPSLSTVMNDQQRAGAVNELVTTLHLARSTAITRNQSVTVCASGDGLSCGGQKWEDGWIAFVDADLDHRPDEAELLNTGMATGADVTIRSAEFQPHLSYRATGQIMVNRLDENTGAFSICDARGADAARVVVILPAGLPRLTEKQIDGSPARCPDR
jgi:type IV fimbrial biogenesis protein FimT